MHKKAAVFALCLSFALAFPAPAAPITYREDRCKEALHDAASQYVEKEFSGIYPLGFSLAAFNDLQCGNPSTGPTIGMANAMLIVTGNKSAWMAYRLVHVHFYIESGRLISTAGLKEWTRIEKARGNEWKQPWCNFIFSVYPKEATKQGC